MSGQISTQDITTFETTTGEVEMTDAPEKIWISPLCFPSENDWGYSSIEDDWEDEGGGIKYTRTDLAEADKHKAYLTGVRDGECAAYLRGLEDAAKVAERRAVYARNAPDWKPIPPLIEAEALRLAAAIRALAKEDGE